MKEQIKLKDEKRDFLSVVYHIAILFALVGATVFQFAQKSWVIGAIFLVVTLLKGYYLFSDREEPIFPTKR